MIIKQNNLYKHTQQMVKTNNTYKPVHNIYCKVDNTYKPVYTYGWDTGEWSTTCSQPCGTGTQTRSVTCKRDNNLVVPDAHCTYEGLTRPETTRQCNTQACTSRATYQWKYGRSTSGNTRILFANYVPPNARLRFNVIVTDMCSKKASYLHIDVMPTISNPVLKNSVWKSRNLTSDVCDHWDEYSWGTHNVTIPGDMFPTGGSVYLRGEIPGEDNCCRSIIVRNFTIL